MAHIHSGTIKTRHMKDDGAIELGEVHFRDVNELFTLCLTEVTPSSVDKIVLSGHDDSGRERSVTFTLQSVTDPAG